MNEDRQVVFIAAYPKSGSTFLTRLVGDILASPTGGCMPEQDGKEIATEGQDRPGPYIVRKGHYVLIDDGGPGPIVPAPHRLAWQRLVDEPVIFLVRDPRDICVSGAYHWHTTPARFLLRMARGDVARCGRWDEYVSNWLDVIGQVNGAIVQYERLLGSYAAAYLWERLAGLGLAAANDICQSLERQSFAARSAGLDEAGMRRNNMRRGVAGDWRNYFTPAMNERIWGEFGRVMERLGYEK